MTKTVAANDCCGCMACSLVCPNHSIEWAEDAQGFLSPKVTESCLQCGLCASVCPMRHTQTVDSAILDTVKIFAAKHVDRASQLQSTSGGVFTAISDWILSQNGVVVGAAYNDQMEVCHTLAFHTEQRNKQRGSKYVQSKLGDCYAQTIDLLKAGRIVLFTGSPCQIMGLRNLCKYWNLDTSNLYTSDIVCHGGSSPSIFRDHIAFLEQKYKKKVVGYDFRKKWHMINMEIRFENGTILSHGVDEQMVMNLFLENITLCPACFSCPYAKSERVGDMTMGDYWGIEKVIPDFADAGGVSMLMLNTEKGQRLFEQIKDKLILRESCLEGIGNPSQPHLGCPASKPDIYEQFRQDYAQHGFPFILEKYFHYGWKVKIRNFYWKWDWKIRNFFKAAGSKNKK